MFIVLGSANVAIAEDTGRLMVFEADTASFAVSLDELEIAFESDGGERMFFRMNSQDRMSFTAFSAAVVGERVITTICSEVVLDTVIQAQIDSGVGILTFADSIEIEVIQKIVQGEGDCPDDRDE